MRLRHLTFFVLLALPAIPQTIFAQQRSSSGGFTGSTGATGYGGAGGTSNNFSSMGGAGAVGASGSSSGAGGKTSSGTFGSRTLGGGVNSRNSAAGKGSQGTNNVGNPGEVGQMDGNERFTRTGRAAGQFVGADTADTANMLGVMAQQQAMALQGLSRGMQQNANQNQQQGNMRTTKTVRAIRSVEFAYTAPAAARLNVDLSRRLSNMRSLGVIPTTVSITNNPLTAGSPTMFDNGPVVQNTPATSNAQIIQNTIGANVIVNMDGRTAILTGSVPTAHARDLAARLCLLEPGVSKVENRLSTPEVLPPPATP